MKKIKIIITVLVLGIFTAALLCSCTDSGNKADNFKSYSEAVAAGMNTESFYIKYSDSTSPNVTQKLNYAVTDGLAAFRPCTITFISGILYPKGSRLRTRMRTTTG